MLAIIRFIYDLLKKEELIALGYIRQHRRRSWLITLDALITMALVFGATAYASESSHQATSTNLMHIGAIPMTSTQFIDHVHASGSRTYWLGPIKGFDVSSDERDENVQSLSYIENGANPNDMKASGISVVTSGLLTNSQASYDFFPGVNVSTSVTASGRIVKYDATSMMDEMVSITGNSSKVSIHYSSAQTLDSLMANAMDLRIG